MNAKLPQNKLPFGIDQLFTVKAKKIVLLGTVRLIEQIFKSLNTKDLKFCL